MHQRESQVQRLAGDSAPAYLRTPGRQTLVQQHAAAAAAPSEGQVHAAAERGVATPSGRLPFAATIQRAFGRHDISGIQAHTGEGATHSARAMGADAFAAGDHVVLGRGTDLFTVAHEAAHVVQQRAGVQLNGGVGAAGDAHERHADAVAERVVRGESAEALLDQYTGADAAARGGASGVQRYASKALDGKPWRLSEQNRILVPEAMTHEMYAEPTMIGTANDRLGEVGSFIHIEPGSAQPSGREAGELAKHHGLVQVRASLRDTGATTLHKARNEDLFAQNWSSQQSSGKDESPLKTYGDCEQCARLVMGAKDAPDGGDLPVVSPGHDDRTYEPQPFESFDDRGFRSGSRNVSPLEMGSLTALNQAFLAYLGAKQLDLLLEKGFDGQQVETFRVRSNSIRWDDPAEAWGVLHDLQVQTPDVYGHFVKWAGIDSGAQPQIGEALVTFRTEGTHGKKLTKAPTTYDSIARAYGEGPVQRERVGAIVESAPELYKVIKKLLGDRFTDELRIGEIRVEWIRSLTRKDDLRKEIFQRALHLHQRKTGEKLLTEKGIEITPDTPYERLVDKDEKLNPRNDDGQIEKYGEPDFHRGLSRKELWNKHWGGVILTDGGDYATLENDASTKEPSTERDSGDHSGQSTKGEVNAQWRYQLYGSVEKGQSFHEQMMETGDFGTLGATMRYHTKAMGKPLIVKAPRVELEQKEVLAVRQTHDEVKPWSELQNHTREIVKRLGLDPQKHEAAKEVVLELRNERREVVKLEIVKVARRGITKNTEIFKELGGLFATIGIMAQLNANRLINEGLLLAKQGDEPQLDQPRNELVEQPVGPSLPPMWRAHYLDKQVGGHFGGFWYARAVVQALDRYWYFVSHKDPETDRTHIAGIVEACEQFARLESTNKNELPYSGPYTIVVHQLWKAATAALDNR